MGVGPAAQLLAVGIDAGRGAAAAVRYAAGLAGDRGWDLLLVHGGTGDGDGEAVVARVLAQLALDAGTRVHRVVTPEAPPEVLRRVSAHVSVLALGQDRRELGDPLVTGRVAAAVVSGARGPVVLVPWGWDPADGGGRPVVVALALARAAGPSLRCAFAEAALRGVPVVVLHTAADPAGGERGEEGSEGDEASVEEGAEVYADAVAVEHRRHPEVEARTVVVAGDPRRWVPDRSVLASLVVAAPPQPGVHQTGWPRSAAGPVLLRSGCPLLVAPTDEAPPVTAPPHRRRSQARRL